MMSDHSNSPIFQPFTLGHLQLPNRVVMCPLTRSRSNDAGVPPDFAADYYAQRADAGLIISEATNISAQARGYALTPGIWTPEQVESWTRVTRAVHKRGGRIFLQLWHTGRISHPDLHGGALPVAPSAIKPSGQAFTNDGLKEHVTPRALETDEIPAIVEDYRHAAQCAKDADFDGVEIHSANNYLLEQFIRDTTNQRTDQYGGSIENRLRFPLDVVRAVIEVWGGGQRVGIRISPATTMPGETSLDSDPMATYGAYVDALSKAGLVYIHDIEGTTQLSRDPSGVDFVALRQRFNGAYIANNQYTLKLAEETLAAGKADLFSFGRPFIANPDLVNRMRTGAPLAEAPKEYWYGGGRTGYSDWPGMDGPIHIER
ncbi:alkene reductase [Acidocella aminolytica]|uniref:NADH:flavin oxidoreductase n=1 Tax=Acidocella aminolytica 101 = DSM 11237 TaxID=1120923 RepID=A0A0D6PIN7_9PROT|nr:alkene reductase [Acidocella aminolytica]GAN81542.1 NADH:flavin oxidoreductase [Acidocella aminolytica 101 = DSM 11237]GBQ44960.1 NADH:flavin oxidoreductase [Acidocella aminolytica 101 = DSM 11237]SHF53029.1 N-ethylmaleimide reductase [Acidocella aminolytica 101 = DSM 11237]